MVAVVIFFTYSLAIWISRGGEFVDALKDASAKGDLEVGLPEEVLIDVPENWRSMVYSLKIFSEMSLMKMFSKMMFFLKMILNIFLVKVFSTMFSLPTPSKRCTSVVSGKFSGKTKGGS